MTPIYRNFNIINGQEDLEHLHTFENFPVFMGCTACESESDIVCDMSWYISRSTGIIQLNPLVPEEIIYAESHGAGSVGKIWQQHHREFSKFISNLNPTSVLEIGGGHGQLSMCYREINDIPWTIVEPNPIPVEGVTANYIKGFFDDKFFVDEEFDLVVHSHVFEHVFQPDEFFKHLSSYVQPGKRIAFSLPNMQAMLERYYTNCINFEHTLFLTEPYIEHILSKNGFEIEKKEYFMEDHSIFYVAVRNSLATIIDLPIGIVEGNKALFFNYINYYQKLIKEINEVTQETNRPVYMFGAHIFSQSLIGFGLDTSKIQFLLDNDVSKHDKRLYGTNLTVKSPKILATVKNPLIILKAGVYNNEIKEDILTNINAQAEFLE